MSSFFSTPSSIPRFAGSAMKTASPRKSSSHTSSPASFPHPNISSRNTMNSKKALECSGASGVKKPRENERAEALSRFHRTRRQVENPTGFSSRPKPTDFDDLKNRQNRLAYIGDGAILALGNPIFQKKSLPHNFRLCRKAARAEIGEGVRRHRILRDSAISPKAKLPRLKFSI